MIVIRGILVALLLSVVGPLAGSEWPQLPDSNGAVELPAQEWPLRPGPRTVRVLVNYPKGQLANVRASTGVMLTLHNWGGTDCVGTASPQVLADRLNVVALCVNYLQSGRKDSIESPEPYDHGYLQALDALRALWWVLDRAAVQQVPLSQDRLFCTGGSGGGNVSLMANKLAPRTFACVIDMCGMKKLSNDVAFNLPGGVDLDARWSPDPNSRYYLSTDDQQIRFVGNPDHLEVMRGLESQTKIIVVHGVDDSTYADAVEMVGWMKRAGLHVEAKWVTPADVDGRVFTTTGHALGNRTEIVLEVAGKYLRPDSPESLRRPGSTDFQRHETLRYATTNGNFVINYSAGYPVAQFEKSEPVANYSDHQDLGYYIAAGGERRTVRNLEDWSQRRRDIIRNFERVIGSMPSPLRRVPLDLKVLEEVTTNGVTRRKITYQSDPNDRVPAYLLIPSTADQPRPAILCLQQTTNAGKDEPAGVRGDSELAYGRELAERGYVVIVPDYPSFGEHPYEFGNDSAYVSGSMKAVWDNIRAIDVLEAMPNVDVKRIGCIGHSLGGHNAIFTSVFEPRIRAVVSSCGFSSMSKDDLPSWTGPRYMPKISADFANDVRRLPFDFHELVGVLAPRPFFASAATEDNDFDVSGVEDVIRSAGKIYELFGQRDRIEGYYPQSPHSFPRVARERAYTFLDRHLMLGK